MPTIRSDASVSCTMRCSVPCACGYMLGKLTFLAARKKARDALGAGFDIKSFHDAMLVGGAVPLAMIDGMTERYIASRKMVVQTRT